MSHHILYILNGTLRHFPNDQGNALFYIQRDLTFCYSAVVRKIVCFKRLNLCNSANTNLSFFIFQSLYQRKDKS